MTGEQLDTTLLKRFSPLDGLKHDNLTALAGKVQIRELSPSQTLFKEGDTEKRTVYVVSGTLELLDQGEVIELIEGESDAARNPVAPVFPRRFSARARDRVQYISIDSDLLDVMLTWDQTGTYEVSELRGCERRGWRRLDDHPACRRKPSTKSRRLTFRRSSCACSRSTTKPGDVVVKQGTEGDYFYVLTRGTVPRDPGDAAEQRRYSARGACGRRHLW